MTRHASRDELAMLAQDVPRHRKAPGIGARTARCTRLTLPGGPGDGRKRQFDTTASPGASSWLGSASQRNAPGPREDRRSDADLLRRHVAGDGDAFGELFRRHRDRLSAVAFRTLRDPEEAADALQDAMIAAFRRADSFRGDSAVTTWLYRIVVNAALDRIRSRAARPTTACQNEEALDALASGGQSLADPSECSDTAIDVRAALRRLVPEQQAALFLVDMLDYPVAAAAQVLGVSEGTVKTRAARGRARLRPRLEHLRPAALAEQVWQNRYVAECSSMAGIAEGSQSC